MKKIKQEIPDWFYGDIYEEGAEVTNRFGGDSYYLNNVELSIYDFAIGVSMYLEHIPTSVKMAGKMSETSKRLTKDLIRALDWFKYNNAEAYMKLLD